MVPWAAVSLRTRKRPSLWSGLHIHMGWTPTRPLRAGLLFGAVLRTADAPSEFGSVIP